MLFSSNLWAFSSSSFLVSQSAFKNYDYDLSISHLGGNELNVTNTSLLDKIIAAVITKNLNLANRLANEILLTDKNNQEAYIVNLVYYYNKKNYDKINYFYKKNNNINELIDFIFFNDGKLKKISA